MTAEEDLESRWAPVFRDDTVLRKPGFHVIAVDEEIFNWMGWVINYLAMIPLREPRTVAVVTNSAVAEYARRLDASMATDVLEKQLLAIAADKWGSDAYIFDMMLLDPAHPQLTLDSRVQTFAAGSADLVVWDDSVPGSEMDGGLFAISDENGIAAWAGIKCPSPRAQYFQVATRPDARRRGYARIVASHAVVHLQEQGITPYYAYVRGNDASEALARSMGFVPYGFAVIAESKEN